MPTYMPGRLKTGLFFLLILGLLSAGQAMAQSRVGLNQPSPSTQAILEAVASNRGVLIPRMDSTAAATLGASLGAQDAGIMIFNTESVTNQYWNGTCWLDFGNTRCYDFTVDAANDQVCLLAANGASSSTVVTVDNLLTSPLGEVPVYLAVTGLPTGVTAEFGASPIVAGTSTSLTFKANAAAVANPSSPTTITIKAIYSSAIRQTTLQLYIFPSGVTASAANATVTQINENYDGNGAIADTREFTVQLTLNNTTGGSAFCGTASSSAYLFASNLPQGVFVEFVGGSTVNVPPGGTNVDVRIKAGACTPVNETEGYEIFLVSRIASIDDAVPFTLFVRPSVLDIERDTFAVDLFVLAGNPECPVDFTTRINPGITVGGSFDNQKGAIDSGNLPFGTNLTISNSGTIVGKGGDGGGNSVSYGPQCPGIDGEDGGNAIVLRMPGITVINNAGGTIAGGGGGGGGGQEPPSTAGGCFDPDPTGNRDEVITGITVPYSTGTFGNILSGGGGGGGAGIPAGRGGNIRPHISPPATSTYPFDVTDGPIAIAGTDGTSNTAGTGGNGSTRVCNGGENWDPIAAGLGIPAGTVTYTATISSGDGGDGGSLGIDGENGGADSGDVADVRLGSCNLGLGGKAGCAIKFFGYDFVFTNNGNPVPGAVSCP